MKTVFILLFTLFSIYENYAQTCFYVDAGPDQTIQATEIAYLYGSACPANMKIKWLTSGTGYFSDKFSLTTKYYPSAADIAAGEVKLTLQSRRYSYIKDDMLLTILNCPTVDAGPAYDTICGEITPYYDLIASINGSYDSVRWTTSGSGFFYDEYNDTTIYEPSPMDIGLGDIEIYFTVYGPGTCIASDTIRLRINDPARMDLPDDPFGVCDGSGVILDGGISGTAFTVYWTSSGTGTFSENPASITTYTPSLQDRINGNDIYIDGITNDPPGICPPASDFAVIQIGSYALAMDDTTLCANPGGGSMYVHAQVNDNFFMQWTTNGFGYFDQEDTCCTYYNFPPSDVGLAQIQLSFLLDNYGACGAYTDIVNVQFDEEPFLEFPQPYVYACKSSPEVYADVYIYGVASSGTWTSSGTGTFTDPGSTYTAYHPSEADLEAGCVDFYFTTNDPSGPCGPAFGSMTACWYDCRTTTNADKMAEEIVLYPNPATHELFIRNAGVFNQAQVTVRDITGNNVSYSWVSNKENCIDVSAFPSGVYVLDFGNGEKSTTLKFIKE